MLSVVMGSVSILNVTYKPFMLSVVRLNVVMLSVVAPSRMLSNCTKIKLNYGTSKIFLIFVEFQKLVNMTKEVICKITVFTTVKFSELKNIPNSRFDLFFQNIITDIVWPRKSDLKINQNFQGRFM
jgi:hypothetical protein